MVINTPKVKKINVKEKPPLAKKRNTLDLNCAFIRFSCSGGVKF